MPLSSLPLALSKKKARIQLKICNPASLAGIVESKLCRATTPKVNCKEIGAQGLAQELAPKKSSAAGKFYFSKILISAYLSICKESAFNNYKITEKAKAWFIIGLSKLEQVYSQ